MDVDKQRQMLVLFITGVIVVIVITIFMLIAVWNKNEEQINEAKEYKVGKIDVTEDVSSETYIQKYYAKLEQLLIEEDYDSLYGYLGQDYIEYSGMTKEKFKEYLVAKKIMDSELILKTYEIVVLKGFNNIYLLNIKQKEGIYDLNVVVREEAPNIFTIAFDDYVATVKSDYNNTVDSINLNISTITYFSNYVEYNMTIKNLHDDTIILNNNNLVEGISLKLSNSTLIQPYNTVFGGRKIKIEPNRIKEYKIKYNVENSNINYIESIVMKGIYYSGRELTSDSEFIF